MRAGEQGLRTTSRMPRVAACALALAVMTSGCASAPIEATAADRARVTALVEADPALAAGAVDVGGGAVGSRNLRYVRPSVTLRTTLLPALAGASSGGPTTEQTAVQALARDEQTVAKAWADELAGLRGRGWSVTFARCEVIATVGVALNRIWLVEARRMLPDEPSAWSMLQLSADLTRRYGSDTEAFPAVSLIQVARVPFHLDEPSVFAPPSGLPPGGLTSTCADAQILPATEQTEGTAFPPLVDGPPR